MTAAKKTDTPDAPKNETGEPETGTETGTGETETTGAESGPMAYSISIYTEKKSETTGKMRRTVAGTVRSNGPNAVGAVDDLKAVLAKVAPEKLANIVEIRIVPETVGAGATINL